MSNTSRDWYKTPKGSVRKGVRMIRLPLTDIGPVYGVVLFRTTLSHSVSVACCFVVVSLPKTITEQSYLPVLSYSHCPPSEVAASTLITMSSFHTLNKVQPPHVSRAWDWTQILSCVLYKKETVKVEPVALPILQPDGVLGQSHGNR